MKTGGAARALGGREGGGLVAFRDATGKAGLIDEFCPHRRASLAYARNEKGGLRCVYHGWQTDVARGPRARDAPRAPKEHDGEVLAAGATAYPCGRRAACSASYMGPLVEHLISRLPRGSICRQAVTCCR